MDSRTSAFSVLHYLPDSFSCSLNQWCSLNNSSSAPLLLSPSIFPRIRVFSSESALWNGGPRYWRFSFTNSPSNKYSGLISFRIDGSDLAVQRTFKSFLQHHNLKASVLQCSVFFMVQLSHLYITTAKNHGFDSMDLCQQSGVSAFYYVVYVCHSFSSKERAF